MVSALGIPRLMMMGMMMTPMATTAPAPNRVEKIAVVTMESRTLMTIGLFAAQLNGLAD